jgi:hypothetical protein
MNCKLVVFVNLLDFDRYRCIFRTNIRFRCFRNTDIVSVSGVTVFDFVSDKKYENGNGFSVYRPFLTVFIPNRLHEVNERQTCWAHTLVDGAERGVANEEFGSEPYLTAPARAWAGEKEERARVGEFGPSKLFPFSIFISVFFFKLLVEFKCKPKFGVS